MEIEMKMWSFEVTLGKGLQITGWLERFSEHRCVFMHHLTMTGLLFLSWTHNEASNDGPQRVCVWKWQMPWMAVTQRCALSSEHSSALTWSGMVGDHQLGLQESCWLQYCFDHVSDLPMLPGCSFTPTVSWGAWDTSVKDGPIHSDGIPPGATSWFAMLTRPC